MFENPRYVASQYCIISRFPSIFLLLFSAFTSFEMLASFNMLTSFNRGYLEDERRFLIYCPGYDIIRNELRSLF